MEVLIHQIEVISHQIAAFNLCLKIRIYGHVKINFANFKIKASIINVRNVCIKDLRIFGHVKIIFANFKIKTSIINVRNVCKKDLIEVISFQSLSIRQIFLNNDGIVYNKRC